MDAKRRDAQDALERDAAGPSAPAKQGTEIASGKILLKRDLRADQRGGRGQAMAVKLSEQEETNGNTIFFGRVRKRRL